MRSDVLTQTTRLEAYRSTVDYNGIQHYCLQRFRYTVCLKYTFEMAAELKTYDSVGKGLYVSAAYGLNFSMTPTSLKIIHVWVSTH